MTHNLHYFHLQSSPNSISEISTSDQEKNLKTEQNNNFFQKMQKIYSQIDGSIRLDCSEEELEEKFKNVFHTIIISNESSVDCYNIIISLLCKYFKKKTLSANIEKCVIEFLVHKFLLTVADLCMESHYDDEPLSDEKMFLKLQVLCLLECFCTSSDTNLEETDIKEKLFWIQYVYGEDQLRNFVKDILYEEYGFTLPTLMQSIADHFKIQFKEKKRKLSNTNFRCNKFLNSNKESDSRICECTPKKRGRRRVIGYNENYENSFVEDSFKESTPSSEKKESYLFDLKTSENFEDNDDYSEFEPSTSRRKTSRLCAKKRSQLQIDSSSEEEIKTKKSYLVNKEKSKKSKSLSEDLFKKHQKSTQQTLNNTHRIGKIILPVFKFKQKIVTKKTDIKNINSDNNNKITSTKIYKKKQFCLEVNEKNKRKLTSQFVTTNHKEKTMKVQTLNPYHQKFSIALKSSPIELSKNAADVVNAEKLVNYKNRMEMIKGNARAFKFNADEVFYGRSSLRKGLFFDDEEEKTLENKSKSSQKTIKRSSQKNRSGRAVKLLNDDCVYVAHTLLNVNNGQPLSPFKARNVPLSNSPNLPKFKLRKYVRPANRSERKRLKKFKQFAAKSIKTQNDSFT